ncbi:hypothetical protein BJV74DRAFT_169347 [Russula compacta]|nr:hypothetical protein BJV74DRAFT_169347 [Russula compacta]
MTTVHAARSSPSICASAHPSLRPLAPHTPRTSHCPHLHVHHEPSQARALDAITLGILAGRTALSSQHHGPRRPPCARMEQLRGPFLRSSAVPQPALAPPFLSKKAGRRTSAQEREEGDRRRWG